MLEPLGAMSTGWPRHAVRPASHLVRKRCPVRGFPFLNTMHMSYMILN